MSVAMHLQVRFIDAEIVMLPMVFCALLVSLLDGIVAALLHGCGVLVAQLDLATARRVAEVKREWQIAYTEQRLAELAAMEDAIDVPGLANVRHHLVNGNTAAAREELEHILDCLDSCWRQYA